MKTTFLKNNLDKLINFVKIKSFSHKNEWLKLLANKTLKSWICNTLDCDGDSIALLSSRRILKDNKYTFNDVFNLVNDCAKHYGQTISKDRSSIHSFKVGQEYKRPDIWVRVNNYENGPGMFFSNLCDSNIEYLICIDHKINKYGYISFSDDNTYKYDCQKRLNSSGTAIVVNKFVDWVKNSKNSINKKILLFVETNHSKFMFRGYQRCIDIIYQTDNTGEHATFVFVPENINDLVVLSSLEEKNRQNQEQENARLSDEKLEEKAKKISDANENSQQNVRSILVKQYKRNQTIIDHVIRKAKGKCVKCGKTIGLDLNKDIPELQCHHVKPLSCNGKDTIDNCIAVCPNCHRHIHKYLLKKE